MLVRRSVTVALAGCVAIGLAVSLLTNGVDVEPSNWGTTHQLPLSFEQHDAQFFARGPGYVIGIGSTGATLWLQNGDEPPTPVKLNFPGTIETAAIPEEKLPGTANYFLGDDPAQWRTDVPTFASVRFAEVYPGIDLVFHGRRGELEYDFLVSAEADASLISVHLEGAESLQLDARGELVVKVPGGVLRQRRPRAFEAGREVPVAAQLEAPDRIRFALAEPRNGAVLIDPVLVYSTYFGRNTVGQSIAVDTMGSAYIAGSTTSVFGVPTMNPLQGSPDGGLEAFVTKLTPAGDALVYSTYLGGRLNDEALGIALDPSGNVYLVGNTQSTNFPVVMGFQPSPGGMQDLFVAKLNPAGNALLYSTYLGGNDLEEATGIAVGPTGSAHVTGYTASTNFPTQAAVQSTFDGGASDAFVTKLTPNGSGLVFSTYLGGFANDRGNAIAVDSSGNAYLAGDTNSFNYPTTMVIQPYGGAGDVVVSKLTPTGGLVYSTFVGGIANDYGNGVAIDAALNVYITGKTDSTNFPLLGPMQSGYDGGLSDFFVTQLNPAGTITWSTYLGGALAELGYGIALDSAGGIYLVGASNSPNFVNTGGIQPTLDGGVDGVVIKINPGGTSLAYSTFIGGRGSEVALAIAVDSAGSAYVTGFTDSTNFPVVRPYQATQVGATGALILKLSAVAVPDAGSSGVDAGLDAGSDGGSGGVDGGTDGGLVVGPDGGLDAGSSGVDGGTDGGTAGGFVVGPDGGMLLADGGQPWRVEHLTVGCGCQSGTPGGAWWLGLFAVAVLRRRFGALRTR